MVDTGFSSGENYAFLEAKGITSFIPAHGTYKGDPDHFMYVKDSDHYLCPQGETSPLKKCF
ncbi:MAG: hypothetical protein P8Q53_03655 [Flavobacteriaceae bacterium]|nr:hypothetical protein [Flavobacteriaceae bacterium]